MIDLVEFHNFKLLRDAKLPLGRFTLLVGPNGSGKSTAIEGLSFLAHSPAGNMKSKLSCVATGQGVEISVSAHWGGDWSGVVTQARWRGKYERNHAGRTLSHAEAQLLEKAMGGLCAFSFTREAIIRPAQLTPTVALEPNGGNLPIVLDRLRDEYPERFESINARLSEWLPEFDRVLFDTPAPGQRAIVLRTRTGGHRIPAAELSAGTLLALAILTLAHLPEPPSLVCLEEPDRGIHPRLLRDARDALHRLSHPEEFAERRPPVQVLATTHSPYLLDLFGEHPEEVVIAERRGLEANFQRLSDRADVTELLEGSHLGDVWYSGVLGGVPANT